MRASNVALLLIAALVSTSACDDDDVIGPRGGENGSADIGSGQQPPTIIEWRATLVATELDSTINGDAVVQMRDGETAFTATISIRQDVPDSIRPWHVHFGTCLSGGGIVGNDAAYPRFGVGDGGFSSTAVQIRVGLDPRAPYHVNVHYSDAMFDRIIACGDLILR